MSKLWAGRFSKDITKSVLDYTQTVDIDSRLIASDIWGSIAHLIMLDKQKIISEEDSISLLECLLSLFEKANNLELTLDVNLEDVHLNIESILISKLGRDIGGKLHTARSRNDQVVTDTRIYVRESILLIQQELISLIQTLIDLSEPHLESVIPGYTHSQSAQPITVAYWLSSYASMFMRDLERLSDAYLRVNISPLGACALAGTSFKTDRGLTAKLLGFEAVLVHGLDATSSRDFIIETLSCFSILMSNFSKIAEEIVWWNSFEFNLVSVDDSFATGSSIMPQKKNPVIAELVRGRTGKVYGSLVQMLTIVKSVSSGYSCDLQEDKPYLWQSIDTTLTTVSMVREQIINLKFNVERGQALCWKNFSTATELANYLVSDKGFSFRESHEVVGSIVGSLAKNSQNLSDLGSVRQLLLDTKIDITTEKLKSLFDPSQAIYNQISEGSTSPHSVNSMLIQLSKSLREQEVMTAKRSKNLKDALSETLLCATKLVKNKDL